MAVYRIVAAVNTAPGHYDGYNRGRTLAYVTPGSGADTPIVFAIDACDIRAALTAMWEIGNRVTDDGQGRQWPRDVRSLSIGDVLVVYAPGEPLVSGPVQTFAVAPVGFDAIPAPEQASWVRLEGSDATSRTPPVHSPSPSPVPQAPCPGRESL